MKLLNVLCPLVVLLHVAISHPMCRDTTGPRSTSNTFCAAYSGATCCSESTDTNKQALFQALGIADETCANYMKGLLCSECDPYAAHLYGDEYQTPSKIPSLCHDYCKQFYTACGSVSMNWPAETPSVFGANPISSTYDEASFCTTFYSTVAPDYCYNGTVFEPIPPPPVPEGTPQICLEHFMPNGIAEEEQMLWLADPHDNSDRIFAVYKRGEIFARNRTSGELLGKFMEVPEVVYGGELGLLSMTFHPNFATNRKFYICYISSSHPAPCESDEICGGSQCINGTCNGNWSSVIAEYQTYVNDPTSADLDTERILIIVNQPFANHKSGGLNFGPDGYLYIPIGDGGFGNDPYNNAQNLNRWHGKILRIDVNSQDANLPYHIPSDNPLPFGNRPEIFAYGLRNPWRCSFDRARPSYFSCGDVGQDMYEEVNLIVKGGNYGWRKYEGAHDNPANSVDAPYNEIKPILEYDHNDPRLGSGPSVIGGYFYRGDKDVCNYGRYLYCDWTGPLFSAVETSEGSGVFTTAALSYQCAADSVGCAGIGNILSFSEDDKGDMYILGHEGVMRVADLSRCPGLVTCNYLSITSSTVPSSSTSTVASSSTSTLSTTASASASDGSTSSRDTRSSAGSSSCSSNAASSSSSGSRISESRSVTDVVVDVSSASVLSTLIFAPIAFLLM